MLKVEYTKCFIIIRVGFDEYQVIGMKELQIMTNLKMNEIVALQNNTIFHPQPMVYDEETFRNLCKDPSMNRLIAETFHLFIFYCLWSVLVPNWLRDGTSQIIIPLCEKKLSCSVSCKITFGTPCSLDRWQVVLFLLFCRRPDADLFYSEIKSIAAQLDIAPAYFRLL